MASMAFRWRSVFSFNGVSPAVKGVSFAVPSVDSMAGGPFVVHYCVLAGT